MSDTPPSPTNAPPGEFSRNELIAIYLLATALLAGITWRYLRDAHIFQKGPQVVRGTRDAALQVDLNKASVEDLILLPMIGESRARKIVEHRERRGNFKSVEDLRSVESVNHAVFEAIKGLVTVGPPPGESAASK
ncbi:MAG: helix-hairpin-helix domain-containing protein [Planctomycetes bacterium]|nr:helix-hairpin-helix domain-containing protein [Planctomycetota bacterium]